MKLMQIRDWFRPPRHVLTIFLAVALVSGATLAMLAWLLIQQDKTQELHRRQERVEQAANRAAAVMQRSLADLELQLTAQPNRSLRPLAGVVLFSATPESISVQPPGGLLYYPVVLGRPEEPKQVFVEGERIEFSERNPAAAVEIYTGLAASGETSIRAGALNRLGRLHRKLHQPDAALAAYHWLAQMPDAWVEGLPAGLVAREGLASLFVETGRTADLRKEAAALERDLRNGRWRLVQSEYAFHSGLARGWPGNRPDSDEQGLVARAEAASWLWRNRGSGEGATRRLLQAGGKPVLLLWNSSGDRLHAVIAGPEYLAALGREAVPDPDLHWALSDVEGRVAIGVPPASGQGAIRDAASAKLPWTLYVSATTGENAGLTSRQRLLLLVFAVLGAVLLASTYFILRAISRELRVARLQSDFVAAVSHEFRSPLSSLCQISEMLARDRIPTEDLRRKSYTALESESQRLRRLVESVLDFGRFEAGAYGYHFERIELCSFAGSLIEAFQAKVSADGYRLERSGDEVEVYVQADREALSRALWNLLDNAVKYSPECRTVWVEISRQEGFVTVTVRDQGIGIPPHEQRDIFNKFVRGAESKARHIKGTGIGLAMVREIVRAHGGEIRVSSEPGQGSRFVLKMRTAGGLP